MTGAEQTSTNVWPRVGRLLGWGLVSQGGSSLTNLGLVIVGGRLLGPTGLGVISLGFAVYLIALGFSRAFVSEPLVISTADRGTKEVDGETRAAVTITVTAGCVVSAALAGGGLLFGGHFGEALVLFAPWVVPVLLQDLWRSVLFRDRRGRDSAVNDLTWLAVMIVTAPLVWWTRSEWSVVCWWGLGGAAGAALGFIQTRQRPSSVVTGWDWWHVSAWPVGRWFGAEGVLYSLGSQGVVFMIAALVSTPAVGGLRAVQSLFGPLSVLTPSATLAVLPAISASLAEQQEDRARALALWISSLLVVGSAAYVAGFGLLARTILGRLLGAAFLPYHRLVWAVGVQQVVVASGVGFSLLLKGMRRGDALFASRVVGAGSTIILVGALTAPYGLEGAAWGMAAGSVLGTLPVALWSLVLHPRAGADPGRSSLPR